MSSEPNFVRLATASGLSNLGDGVFQIALPLVALGITRDPGAFASVTLVGRLPWLLFSLQAGALADRLDRRRTMTTVNIARAVLIGGLAVVVRAGVDDLWLLYVVAFCLGVGETLFDTAAQSILPNIVVDHELLAAANSRLFAIELTANQFVGPPLGGLIAGLTITGALTSSAIVYAAAALVLALVVGDFRPVRVAAPARLRTDVAEGIRYLLHHRLLRTLAIVVGISNLASTATFSVVALYAVRPGPLALSGTGFGFLLATLAVGSVVGTVFVERIERRIGRRGALLLASASFGVSPLVLAATASVPWIAIAFLVGSGLNVGWNVVTVSLRQRLVPDHLLGRVNATYRLLAWGTMPIGAALGAAVGSRYGITAVFWTSAALSAVCFAIVVLGVTRRVLEMVARPDGLVG